MTAQERCEKFRAKRKASGLCYRCPNPVVPGSVLCETHRSGQKQYMKDWHADLKRQVIAGYGGECQCEGGCFESRFEFLTIDHVLEDGAEERKVLGSKAIGAKFYRRLIAENFPPEYRLLCWNCNCARGFYGACPHVKQNVVALAAAGGR